MIKGCMRRDIICIQCAIRVFSVHSIIIGNLLKSALLVGHTTNIVSKNEEEEKDMIEIGVQILLAKQCKPAISILCSV